MTQESTGFSSYELVFGHTVGGRCPCYMTVARKQNRLKISSSMSVGFVTDCMLLESLLDGNWQLLRVK